MAISVHNRKIAAALAFAGASPLPLAWLHKFYLGHYLWGITYLLLASTPLPQIACCFEGIWYLSQSDDSFNMRFPEAGKLLEEFNTGPVTVDVVATPIPAPKTAAENIRATLKKWLNSSAAADSPSTTEATERTAGQKTSQIAIALRELDQLRKEGLITEYEFEQKRRKLVEQV